MAIERFQDDYFFLSSMYPVKGGITTVEGWTAPTVEHLYQAKKFPHPGPRAVILEARDGYKAKQLADGLVEAGSLVRPDWDDVKLDIMIDLVERKFVAGSRLAYLLLRTGEEELVEGNTRGDRFWGVDPPYSRNGLNWLGRILMNTRMSLHYCDKRVDKI